MDTTNNIVSISIYIPGYIANLGNSSEEVPTSGNQTRAGLLPLICHVGNYFVLHHRRHQARSSSSALKMYIIRAIIDNPSKINVVEYSLSR